MEKITYKFKKGDTVHLDQIYSIQGLCGGRWWEKKDDDEMEDWCVIVRNIKITIIEESF